MPNTIYEHAQVTQRFRRTLSRGRLASTYLFVGPEGVGKRSFAKRLAAALLCGAADSTRQIMPCGVCESCRLIDADSHPDLLQVARPEGKSTLPLELFIGAGEKRNREGLCHDIALKPYLGDRRAAIIDDADALSTESANCLLKTLEEPPPRSLLILVGTSLSRQLPTIRSRCQVVRFGPLTPSSVARVLQEQSLLEEGDDADTLATASQGSVSHALAARDHEATAFQQEVVKSLSGAHFNPVRLSDAANAFCSPSGAEPAVKRKRLSALVASVIEFYRQQMTTQDELPTETAIACLDHCLNAEQAVHRNANQATLIQAWFMALWRAHHAGE